VGPNNAQQQWPVRLEALQHQQSSTTTYEAVSAADQQGGEDGDESSPSDDDDESSTSSSTRTRDGIVNVNTKGQQHKKDFKSRLQQHLMKVFGVEMVKVTQHGEYVEAKFLPPLHSPTKIELAKKEIKSFDAIQDTVPATKTKRTSSKK